MAAALSFTAYAKLHGWSQPYVSKLVKQGRIPVTKKGLIDPEAADAALASMRSHAHDYARRQADEARQAKGAAPTPGIPGADASFQRARTLRETFSARLAQLGYERMVGRLVRVEEFENAYADKLAAARDELLTVPDRIAATVAAKSDPAECWRIIDEAIRVALRHVAEAKPA